jgi:DNA modification methylase
MKPYYQDDTVTLYHGGALGVLRQMDEESVNCVVTSPPYWRMRDYQAEGQLGMEETPELYTAAVVEIFEEVCRVLRSDGTLWLNLGDSYASGGWGGGAGGQVNYSRTWDVREQLSGWRGHPEGLKHKDLVGIPWRVAFALQAAGWYLRSEIIWQKPNVLPEAVKDRPTKAHEHIFLMSKQPSYFYDADAIKVKASPDTHVRGTRIRTKIDGADVKNNRANSRFLKSCDKIVERRNKRDVWRVPTVGFKGAHFSTFPPKLITPCILAGCPASGIVLDPFVGSGTTCAVSKELGRRSIGIDLWPDFLDMVKDRIRQGVFDFGGSA